MPIINWLHVLIIAPLFVYIGGWYATQPSWVYWLLLVMGLVVTLYHGQKMMASLPSPWWVSVFHALVVGPVLIWLGWTGQKSPEFLYPVMSLLGFAAFGYHAKQISGF